MARAKRRSGAGPFSLSFLDAMTCGLGAAVLVYMIVSAGSGLRTGRLTGELRADTSRLEEQVLEAQRDLVELRNTREERRRELNEAHGRGVEVLRRIESQSRELATGTELTIAQRESLERLQSDLRSLEQEARRLRAAEPSVETPGRAVRRFVGDGDRQYLTGLKVGGARILILVDASASMLDATVVNVVRRRLLGPEQRISSPKWQQTLRTVEWLVARLPLQSQVQIYTFNTAARAVVEGSAGGWLEASDRAALNEAVARLRRVAPEGGTSLWHAFAVPAALSPPPDSVILLTDGLPTQGEKLERGGTVSPERRLRLFEQAVRAHPPVAPVSVILAPMEGDPEAASALWKLAILSGGAFLTPSRDWP